MRSANNTTNLFFTSFLNRINYIHNSRMRTACNYNNSVFYLKSCCNLIRKIIFFIYAFLFYKKMRISLLIVCNTFKISMNRYSRKNFPTIFFLFTDFYSIPFIIVHGKSNSYIFYCSIFFLMIFFLKKTLPHIHFFYRNIFQ